VRSAGEPDQPLAEPSWTTALTEAEAASRHLRQATAALDRLSRELASLREQSDTTARLDLARALTDGPDGGVLQALVTAASDEEGDTSIRRTAEILLDRLTTTLGLEPVCERGELLSLPTEDLAEFETRGGPGRSTDGARCLYCVARPGWRLDEHLVVRPLLEAIGE
jgi:hypothetical protein